ncbi:flagellar assembly protein FliH [Microvirga tunisiensis]|uniref:Flagellar assembly protein FliH n=1 Tax=Pannonibacter tanglangensis TaxID=2750084 RepID=A0A7X5F1Q1_9HYPH|nr:FliH/SctL family protein [Pannonibacter sp. XCT-53]NBN76854.1 flagellar assembly protein FliH [Pannonibacter sp. XCT-53]
MTRLGKPSKFLFDKNFSEPEVPVVTAPPEPVEPMMTVAEHERLLAAARDEARRQGHAEGLVEGRSGEERRLAEQVGDLSRVVAGLLAEIDGYREQTEKDATTLAFLIARRLSAHLIARNPLAETVALVAECLGPLRGAPHLVIRVAERDVDALKARLDPVVREKGFDGRLVLLGEPEIARGDCRIEWADGGILRDRKALETQIDQSIKSYFEAKAAARAKARQGAEAGARETES